MYKCTKYISSCVCLCICIRIILRYKNKKTHAFPVETDSNSFLLFNQFYTELPRHKVKMIEYKEYRVLQIMF